MVAAIWSMTLRPVLESLPDSLSALPAEIVVMRSSMNLIGTELRLASSLANSIASRVDCVSLPFIEMGKPTYISIGTTSSIIRSNTASELLESVCR